MFGSLKKKGAWIFLAAMVLFFVGQRYLSSQVPKETQSADRILEFDAQGIHAVRIEKESGSVPGGNAYRKLDVQILEPATNITATVSPDAYELKSRVEGDVLVLTFSVPHRSEAQKRRQILVGESDQISLPSSIGTLEFVNSGGVNFSMKTVADLATLDVRFADCPNFVNFENMAVKKMTVTKRCKASQPNSKLFSSSSIRLAHVKTNSLEITSTHGYVNLSEIESTIPLQLNLNDDVHVNADAAQLRNAHFGKAPE